MSKPACEARASKSNIGEDDLNDSAIFLGFGRILGDSPKPGRWRSAHEGVVVRRELAGFPYADSSLRRSTVNTRFTF